MKTLDFTLPELTAAYRNGAKVTEVISEAIARADAYDDPAVWISRASKDVLLARAKALDDMPADARMRLPLFGVPFAVKDNIDAAGLPTTAACPAFAYQPAQSAFAVARLEAAGGIVIGKTNLDQFATGLVGVRSPYGAPRSVFNKDYISGGSSSGSAVAVAAGLVTFAFGTDTAGSGRVPAMLNNIVGLKPTKGLLSTTGVVPACRSLDCISIFATTVQDARTVLSVAAAFDPADPYARPSMPAVPAPGGPLRFAVPADKDLEFFGDTENARLFAEMVARLEAMGGEKVVIDLTPFRETAILLYDGPWVAERTAAVGDFVSAHEAECDPTVAKIVLGGKNKTAVDAFKAIYRLEEFRRQTALVLAGVQFLLVPTAPTTYTVEALKADPVTLNSRMGTYTNFMNLLDLAGIAIPAGFGSTGLPFGVTLVGPAFTDMRLAGFAQTIMDALKLTPGGPQRRKIMDERLEIAVVGAHMTGLPLNHELTSRGGRFVAASRTSPNYKFYALAGGPPFRPGLVRTEGGASIELEVWSLPLAEVGGFLAGVPSPLAIGTLELEDGRKVKGFLCEQAGLTGAQDITSTGGWRKFLAK
jgi:allophanate hydrolase